MNKERIMAYIIAAKEITFIGPASLLIVVGSINSGKDPGVVSTALIAAGSALNAWGARGVFEAVSKSLRKENASPQDQEC